ncbi:MAG: chemotaxis protein CheA [Firmicutes bacterium]|nr:chemotaxis protein CheA [Bacillota bacterium]
MVDLYLFETRQLIEKLEELILSCEASNEFESSIDEFFRIMHTIKASAAMMLYDNISNLAHSVEDLFFYIREDKPQDINVPKLIDLMLEIIDYLKTETSKIENGRAPDGDATKFITAIKAYLLNLKNTNKSSPEAAQPAAQPKAPGKNQKFYISPISTGDPSLVKYQAQVFFDDDSQMESVRAFMVIHNLKNIAQNITFIPDDIMESDASSEIIRREGFQIFFASNHKFEDLKLFFSQIIMLKKFKLKKISSNLQKQLPPAVTVSKPDIPKTTPSPGSHDASIKPTAGKSNIEKPPGPEKESFSLTQHMISVNVNQIDKLLDLAGELIISEAAVTCNPDLKGVVSDNFQRAARHLHKIINELQEVVMSIRMVPLSLLFNRMNRIARDMCHKLNKEVKLEFIGEQTEVDKNILEFLADPLIHIIRNAIDHGIEPARERAAKGKPETGKIIIEAKNTGGDVWIIVKDDGQGLNKEMILNKARQNNLFTKPEAELTDQEIYSFIFLPGFSTKEQVTEYSGRGVGMDIVVKNLSQIGGMAFVDSKPDLGSTISLKIPLTMIIVDGMSVNVGAFRFTIPITAIVESFKIKEEKVLKDPDGNEMVLIRGECFSILRLHQFYNIKTPITKIDDGIMVLVKSDSKGICLFIDSIIGQQQVVIKGLPKYFKKIKGINGCALLNDGSISFILDIAAIFNLLSNRSHTV